MTIGPKVPEEVRCYVAKLQKDGRLLLRHLIRRSDCTLPDIVPVGVASDGSPSEALFVEPEAIATNAAKLAELVNNVDLLSRRAAPANVRSIRLTYAYLNMSVEGGEPPSDIQKEIRFIRRYMLVLTLIALLVFFLSVGLLAHADHGHRLLQQLDDLNHRSSDLRGELAGVPLNEFALEQATAPAPPKPEANPPAADNLARGPFCNNGVPANATPSPANPWRQPLSAKAIDLCRQYDDLRVRFDLIYTELADWNCATRDVTYPWRAFWDWVHPDGKRSCGQPTAELPPEVKPLNWESYDTRAKVSIAMMAGFVLPMMLGCLGGCAYAFRRLDTKLSTWTLEPQDGKHALVRVFLATLLGGLVGVVWTSDQPVTLGGFTLSLAATAFFIGFSVEAVFRLIQSLIDTVTSGIRSPVTPQAAAPETLSVAQVRRITNESVTEAGKARDDRDLSAAPSPIANQVELLKLKDQLKDERQTLAALAPLESGGPVAVDAPATIDAIDSMLANIEPLLGVSADAKDISTAVKRAADTLAATRHAGLPGILADGIATLNGVADFTTPVLAGVPGGPAGIIGGIVLGGLKLYKNEQQFQSLKAALLRQPFDPTLRPHVPDGPSAMAALEAFPFMASRVTNAKDSAFAIALMQRLFQQNTSGEMLPANKLAFDLMQPDDSLGLASQFATDAELARAIEEYRGVVFFTDASKRLDGSVDLPQIGTNPESSISFKALAKAVFGLYADPLASAAIKRTVAVTEALAKLTTGQQISVDLVLKALGQALTIAEKSR